MPSDNTFKIGLCMAGAVSAGAYTAGVMDYLLEALEEWQRRKDSGEANVPSHNVEISAMGGASAGGMTGIISAAALFDPIVPVKVAPDDLLAEIPGSTLYHSWVDLVSANMMDLMLNTDDISKDGLQSGLNSTFIDQIAERAVSVRGESAVKRKYVSKNLLLFVTLSNLNGMDFSVTFRSNTPKLDKYMVTSHNDYVCFRLVEDENGYRGDGFIPLNFGKKLNTELAKNAAMATGAFPVGLKAREIVRDSKYLNDMDWFKYITRDAGRLFPKGDYKTVNVDGGLINNEPFEQLRKILIAETGQDKAEEYQRYDTFKSTVLMVDPFPSEPGEFKGTTALKSVVGNTLSAMIDQSRVKPSTLIDTLDSNNAGQFLIAPVRYYEAGGKEESVEGPLAIACGSLDGFGGFICKEFRIHDYFLGRANCEKFLIDHFTVPRDTVNPIFTSGYSGIENNALTKFISRSDGGLQIIPIFAERKNSAYMPVFSNGKIFPGIREQQIRSYRKKMKKRVEKIILNISDNSQRENILLWIGAKVVLNGKLADAAISTILKSLEKHKLLE